MSKRNCLVRGCLERPMNSVQLCRAHNQTHIVEERPCNGEAHRPEVAGCIDHCMVCMPNWGVIDVAVPRPVPQHCSTCYCPELAAGIKAHQQGCDEY